MLRVLGQAFFGLIVGLLARAILPGRQHMGWIVTMILGVAGAWLGGLIGRATGVYDENRRTGFFLALFGALILVIIYSLIS